MGLEEYTSINNTSEDRFELVTKLYDKLILNLKYIKKYIDFKKPVGILTEEQRENTNFIINNKIEKINQSIDIIDLLKNSLDLETEELKESSLYLYGIYEYQLMIIYKLMVNMEVGKLDKLINVFEEMKLAWLEQVAEIRKNG
jgi:flagellin-specific chaperone FliS